MSCTLTIEKTLTNGVYQVKITTSNFSDTDLSAITKYGDPMIATGGSIPLGNTTFDLNTTDNPELALKAGFASGYTKTWDSDGDDNAGDKATAWANEIRARMQTALNVLRTKMDSFTGTTTMTI